MADETKAPETPPEAPKVEAPTVPPAKKPPTCPVCKGTLDAYAGAAAHKIGTAFCRACGIRHRAEG